MRKIICCFGFLLIVSCGNKNNSKSSNPTPPENTETSLTEDGSFKFVTELDNVEITFPHEVSFKRILGPNGDEFYSEKIDSERLKAPNEFGKLLGVKVNIFTDSCYVNPDYKINKDKTIDGREFNWYYTSQDADGFQIQFIYPVNNHCLFIDIYKDSADISFDYSKPSALSNVISNITRSVSY